MSNDLFHGVMLDVNRNVRASGIPGELAEFDGWMVADSGTGIDALNHALVSDSRLAVDSFDAVRRWFGERSTGFQLLLRVPGDEAVLGLVKARGYAVTRSQPLMAAALPLQHSPLPEGVAAAVVRNERDIKSYLSVRHGTAGRPPDDAEEAALKALIATGRFRYLVAFEDGVPVATSTAAVSASVVSISNVWVAEAARRRGLGGAMTAIAAGFHPDAEWAILEASAMGESVYRRMGFTERFRYVRLAPPEVNAEN